MILSNDDVKALVPYAPAENKPSFGEMLNRLFLSRKNAYLCFLSLVFFVSAFARCISLQNQDIARAAYEEMRDFSQNGGKSFAFRFYFPHFFCAFSAFLAGFTVFALPVSLLTFVHSVFGLSFFYFALTENAADCGFYKGLAALLYLSFFIAAAVLFYSEVLFTGKISAVKGRALSCAACLVCLLTMFYVLIFFSRSFFY